MFYPHKFWFNLMILLPKQQPPTLAPTAHEIPFYESKEPMLYLYVTGAVRWS